MNSDINPFVDAPNASPFDNATEIANPNTDTATPTRTMTLALASAKPSQASSPEAVDALMEQSISHARQVLEGGNEQNARYQIAADRMLQVDKSLRELPAGPEFLSPEDAQGTYMALQQHRQVALADAARTAAEEQAFHNAQSLYASQGDSPEFQAAVNRLDPDKNSTYGVIRDWAVKNQIINSAVERATLDKDQEGFFHWFLSGVVSLPKNLLVGDIMHNTGNVDAGVGGYAPGWMRLFHPNDELGKQVAALQGLNATDLAAALPKFLENVKSNSTTLGVLSAGTQAEILTKFKEGVTGTLGSDIMSNLNLAAILPIGKIFRGTEFLASAGARSAAAKRVAAAIDESVNGGLAGTTSKLGVGAEEIVDNILPTAINPLHMPEAGATKADFSGTLRKLGKTETSSAALNASDIPIEKVSLSSQVNRITDAGRILAERLRTDFPSGRVFNQQETINMFSRALDELKANTGVGIADYTPVEERLLNNSSVHHLEITFDHGVATPEEALGWLGEQGFAHDDTNTLLKEGTTPKDELDHAAASLVDAAKAIDPGVQVVQDISGLYFPRVKVGVAETGILTSQLNPPRQGFITRLFGNMSRTSDAQLFGRGVDAGRYRQDLIKKFGYMMDDYRKLKPVERATLGEALKKMDNMGKWLSNREFDSLWERVHGSPAPELAKNAYRNYQTLNDAEFFIRRDSIYAQKFTKGMKTARFEVQGKSIGEGDRGVDSLIDHDLKSVNGRVFDVSENTHYNSTKENKLTEEAIARKRGEGYVLVKTEGPVALSDGTHVDQFLIKKPEIEIGELSRDQLNYRAGGHRLYADRYFGKQASIAIQKDTGEEFLRNPNAYVTGPTLKHVRDWTSVMEQARFAAKEGRTAAWMDENIFKGRVRQFPTGEEFLNGVEKGQYTLDHPFEALYDREMPAIYNDASKNSAFLDPEEPAHNQLYRTTNQMYSGMKGEGLKNWEGDLAPTVDPFQAQSRALYNVANLSSFQDFKTSAVERWVNTYKGNVHGLSQSPMETFINAVPKEGLNPMLKHQMEGQRESIKRILGFETEWDRGYRAFMREKAEMIIGDSDSKLRQTIGKGIIDISERNPIRMLHGLAFDFKLGMFNPAQVLLQSSTMLASTALSPKFGIKGMFSVPAMRAYLMAVKRGPEAGENMLDLLVKRGFPERIGMEEAEFKQYAKYASQNGFFNLGETHQMINAYGPQSTFAVTGDLHKLREMTRVMFYEPEVWNRLTAFRIAYGEAVETFGKNAFANPEFRDFLAKRSENYSFNMSAESKAGWQNGILSIPTQFWAYNVRMMEAMFGKDFTAAQKMRLAASQFGLLGMGGIPFLGAFGAMVNAHTGSAPDIESAWGVAQRGLLDLGVKEVFGADMQIGKRIATGSWATDLVKDVFGAGTYGEKSVADMVGGATYSIVGDALGTGLKAAAMLTSYESGGETAELTHDKWIELFRNISTVNNFTKAMLASQYGVLTSKGGAVQVDKLPSQDAVWIALSFEPGETLDMQAKSDWEHHRSEAIKDIVKQVHVYEQNILTRPDSASENAKKIGALINLTPPDIRADVIKKIHTERDPSVYSRLIRQTTQDQLTEEGYNDLGRP